MIYTLRVLPEESAAEKYEYSSGHYWNETDKWFFDRLEVGKTGEVKRLFKQFYDDNKEARQPIENLWSSSINSHQDFRSIPEHMVEKKYFLPMDTYPHLLRPSSSP